MNKFYETISIITNVKGLARCIEDVLKKNNQCKRAPKMDTFGTL